MGTPDYGTLVSSHRKYFKSGATRSVEWRHKQLTALRTMMKDHSEDFYAALWTDRSRFAVRRRWQFRDGEVSRRVGVPCIHERTARFVTQHANRLGRPLSAL